MENEAAVIEDILRIVVFAQVAFTTGLVSWISWRYYLAWRDHKRRGLKWRRLLPRHVATVSGMTVILMVEIALAGLYLWVNFVVFSVILFAMRDILVYLRERGSTD